MRPLAARAVRRTPLARAALRTRAARAEPRAAGGAAEQAQEDALGAPRAVSTLQVVAARAPAVEPQPGEAPEAALPKGPRGPEGREPGVRPPATVAWVEAARWIPAAGNSFSAATS